MRQQEPGWLTTEDAAAYTGYSVHTIRDAAAAGELLGHRRPSSTTRGRWRFRTADIDKWLTGVTRRARGQKSA